MTSTSSQPQFESRRTPPREFPRLRALVWTGAMVAGGLLIVLLFFSLVGEVSFAYAYVAGVAIICLAAYFFLTWRAFERSEVRANTRLADRERRGF